MKRTIVFAALLCSCLFFNSSLAVEVKLRSPETRQENPERPVQNVEQASRTTSKNDESQVQSEKNRPKTSSDLDRDSSKKKASDGVPKKENVSKENQETEKSKKGSLEKKNARPSSSLAPLSVEEWEKRYPKDLGATRMTVEALIPTKKLYDVRVLRVFTRVPRVEFLPRKQRDAAYKDVEVLLDDGFHEFRPFDLAFAVEALDLQKDDRALIVETGSGYPAAILSGLAAEVYGVGSDRGAVKHAADVCKKLRYTNVFLQEGNPSEGRLDFAPFDKILVTRAIEEVPSSLVEQLKDGGKIVAPVGDNFRQLFVLGEKMEDGTLNETPLIPTRIEPLNNEASPRSLSSPSIIGGGFEELDPAPLLKNAAGVNSGAAAERTAEDEKISSQAISPTPKGWYDAWNFRVVDQVGSFEGTKACLFENASIALNHVKQDRNEERIRAATLPEERVEITEEGEAVKNNQRERELRCQMSQSFAVDGSTVKKLAVSGAYRISSLESRKGRMTAELVRIDFFDHSRKSVGSAVVVDVPLAPCAWEEFSNDVSVPARAKEATITIGLLDSVGAIEFDGLEARDKFEKASRNRRDVD